MPRHVPVLVAVAVLALAAADAAHAQSVLGAPVPAVPHSSIRSGRIQGLVRDEAGRLVGGVSVVALGATIGAARSDARGHFMLALAPGAYVLRATREGYLSTFRETVQLRTSALIERNIVLVRQGTAPVASPVLMATAGLPGLAMPASPADLAGEATDADHTHDETAWRMRHLTRAAIRDISPSNGLDDGPRNTASFLPTTSSPLASTDFTGQVNWLTTSSVSASNGWLPGQFPRGIASWVVGAPVGSYGDWTVRGALGSTSVSSWVLLGEYRARDLRAHAFTVGMSYSTQFDPADRGSPLSGTADGVKNVGGLYGFDRWRVRPGLQLDYGLRVDRYDYVPQPVLISPRVGARLLLVPRTYATLLVSQRMIAPGAEEFLPPPSAGPWLPPERTFASLTSGDAVQAERVRQYAMAIEHRFGAMTTGPTVTVQRFRQSTADQVATLFGVDATRDSGFYAVATAGSVAVDGWTMRVATSLTPRLHGTVAYSIGQAEWLAGSQSPTVSGLVPALVRADRARLQDVTASVDAAIAETATRVSIAYRAAVSRAGGTTNLALGRGRFDLEVHQATPFQPMRGSTVEVLFAVRNMFRDPHEIGSLYDELLTLAPPLRIMGGVQLKF
jgi:hypothetical protein